MFIKKIALSIVIVLSCAQSGNVFAADYPDDAPYSENPYISEKELDSGAFLKPELCPSGYIGKNVLPKDWDRHPFLIARAIKFNRTGNEVTLHAFGAIAEYCQRALIENPNGKPKASKRQRALLSKLNQTAYTRLLALPYEQQRQIFLKRQKTTN